MKKILLVMLSVFMILSMAACNGNTTQTTTTQTEILPSSVSDTSNNEPAERAEESTEDNTTEESQAQDNNETSGNILIAYFTVPESDGVDAVARASRVVVNGEVLGNTQFIAQAIQREAGGDLFAIETVQPYPARPELMDQGANEKRQNARPELSVQIENPGDYDVIFLGYPNWNADLPMPLYTFLEQYDFSGKTIIPFCPHGGSGFSGTIGTISSLQPGATVITDGFTVSRDNVPNSEDDVTAWVRSLNLSN